MKTVGMAVSGTIFIVMLAVTVRASLEQGIVAAWPAYRANPWAIATLWDAYCGFTIYWLWVAYRERGWGTRIVWFVLIMGLGNIATAAYLFLQLSGLKASEPLERALVRKSAA